MTDNIDNKIVPAKRVTRSNSVPNQEFLCLRTRSAGTSTKNTQKETDRKTDAPNTPQTKKNNRTKFKIASKRDRELHIDPAKGPIRSSKSETNVDESSKNIPLASGLDFFKPTRQLRRSPDKTNIDSQEIGSQNQNIAVLIDKPGLVTPEVPIPAEFDKQSKDNSDSTVVTNPIVNPEISKENYFETQQEKPTITQNSDSPKQIELQNKSILDDKSEELVTTQGVLIPEQVSTRSLDSQEICDKKQEKLAELKDEDIQYFETMTTIKDISEFIPKFKGELQHLESYIGTCSLLHEQLTTDNDKKMFCIIARARLTEKAYDATKNVTDIDTWQKLQKALTDYLSTPMNAENALSQLIECRQSNREKIREYANRVQNLLQILNTASCIGADETTAIFVRNNNEKTAIRIFKYGIYNTSLRTVVKAGNKSTLNENVEYALEQELSDDTIECKTCNKKGHNENDCYTRNKKPFDKNAKCNYCNKLGHLEGDCRKKKADQTSGQTGTKPSDVGNDRNRKKEIRCYKCNKLGHYASDCQQEPQASSSGGKNSKDIANPNPNYKGNRYDPNYRRANQNKNPNTYDQGMNNMIRAATQQRSLQSENINTTQGIPLENIFVEEKPQNNQGNY